MNRCTAFRTQPLYGRIILLTIYRSSVVYHVLIVSKMYITHSQKSVNFFPGGTSVLEESDDGGNEESHRRKSNKWNEAFPP